MYNYQIIYNLIINNKIIDFFILEFIIILALFKFTEIKNIMIILMSLSIVIYNCYWCYWYGGDLKWKIKIN
jgi:Flp pilus assembly protein protease CpaA